jgi:hypothetical protein
LLTFAYFDAIRGGILSRTGKDCAAFLDTVIYWRIANDFSREEDESLARQ